MGKRTLLIVGAAGDVGRGIVAEALASGRKVVAVGRSGEKLDTLAARHGDASLACVAGDHGGEAGARALWDAAVRPFGGIGDAVVTVNAPGRVRQLAEWRADELSAALDANVLTHFIAARTFLPLLPDDGMLIGIGGGTADFIFPGMAHVSMGQAALRMLYRGLARERKSGAR